MKRKPEIFQQFLLLALSYFHDWTSSGQISPQLVKCCSKSLNIQRMPLILSFLFYLNIKRLLIVTCVFSQPNNMKMKIPLMLASLILSMTPVSSEDADLWIKELRVKTGYEHNAGMDGCCVRFVIYNKVLHTHCSKDIILISI